ncbi:hypothetical protein O6P43_005307 [Quillaja saponaria]|uniref:Uncharacterized protein n=1 Tax=Quillaja saponaria TaxID=32244 RepID=A0AAD7Q6F3_QUISA|nr:hypothetical protein O6P43_005307 [Quillaja saponaria]
MEIVTEDKSKYKFKGFLRYESAFRSLQKALKHKEKMALKNNEATDDQLHNAVVMEAVHEKESQSMGTNSVSHETSEQDDQVHEVSDEIARSPEAQVIQEKEKEKETISETLMNTLNLGSKLVEQSGLEKISFLRKKLPSPFKS